MSKLTIMTQGDIISLNKDSITFVYDENDGWVIMAEATVALADHTYVLLSNKDPLNPSVFTGVFMHPSEYKLSYNQFRSLWVDQLLDPNTFSHVDIEAMPNMFVLRNNHENMVHGMVKTGRPGTSERGFTFVECEVKFAL